MKLKGMLISTSVIVTTLAVGMVTPSVAMASTSSPYNFEKAQIVVNGKVLLAGATKFVANNTSYMSLYDAQLLVNQLTGDKSGKVVVDSNGRFNKAEEWNGASSKKYWNIAWDHSVANLVKGSHHTVGNAEFEINGAPVIYASIIVTPPPRAKQPTTFVPIWYLQQVIDQIIYTNSKTDHWDGSTLVAKWTITYDPKQSYNTSGVVKGQSYTGINTPGDNSGTTVNPDGGWK